MSARALHPGAWWCWAIGMAVAVSRTTNPLVLLIAIAVAAFVVVSRRSDSPWARAFRLYLWLGAFVVLLRIVLHVLVGLKTGQVTVLPLPTIDLPDWAAGINLLGDIRLAGLLAAACEGLRLAAMIICVGAANALANPKRLLAALPGALQEIGTAVVIAISVAPQLAESVQRVHRARLLRGDSARGLRAFRRIAMPVLEDTLERSLALAASMDSRGYGRRGEVAAAHRRLTGALMLGSLLAAAVGAYGILDTRSPAWTGWPLLAVGLVLGGLGMAAGSRAVIRTVYRPDPWSGPEWLALACGVAVAAAAFAAEQLSPQALTMPVAPIAFPALPWLLTLGLLTAVLPGLLTPRPPVTRPPVTRRRQQRAPVRATEGSRT